MARTESTMLALGTPAPDFALMDVVTYTTIHRDDFIGKPLLVLFICAHCPYVKHIEHAIAQIARDYAGTTLAIVGISSNDADNYPADNPAGLRQQSETVGFTFPYLYDETQSVAKSYDAACTPDIFLFDAAHKLAYRGQFDNSRPKTDIPVTGADLRAAIDAVLSGTPVPEPQTPSLGCNIKWKE